MYQFEPVRNIVVKTIKELSNEDYNRIISSIDLDEIQDITEKPLIITHKFNTLPNIIRTEKHSAYEILTKSYSRLFIDYDFKGKIDPKTVLSNIHAALITCFNNYNYVLRNEVGIVMNKENISEKYLLKTVVKNVSIHKTSLHIIYPNIIMSIHNIRRLISQMKLINSHTTYTEGIDIQVYRKTGATLRTIYSYKDNDSKQFLDIYNDDSNNETNCSLSDYFISHIRSKNTMYPVMEDCNNTTDLCSKLQNIIGKINKITNLNAIREFVIDPTINSIQIKIEYLTKCNLCNEKIHNNNFYLTKSIDDIHVSYFLNKNGTCNGLPSKPILSINNSQSSKVSTRKTDILFDIACKIVSSDDIRKIKNELFKWNVVERKWEVIPDKGIGSVIIEWLGKQPSESVHVIESIESAITRRHICNNIYDILQPVKQLPCPNNYLMTNNGLIDINTLTYVENYKDYNVSTSMNVEYGHPEYIKAKVVNFESQLKQLEKRKKELEFILSKIVYDDGTQESKDEIVRFRTGLALILTGEHGEIFHFCGPSNGGKSIITNLILRAFGDYGYKGSAESILYKSNGIKEGLANYKDKRVVIISELGEDFIIQESELKNITEDYITADKKFISQYSFDNKSRTIIDSNYPLKVNSQDASVIKRIESFKFKSNFSNIKIDNLSDRKFIRDYSLGDKIIKGYYNDAFLNLLLDWYHEYVINRDLKTPALIKNVDTFYPIIIAQEIKIAMKLLACDDYSSLSTLLRTYTTTNFSNYCPYLAKVLNDNNKNKNLNNLLENCRELVISEKQI